MLIREAKQISNINSKTNISGRNLKGKIGKYENPVADGYWFYLYEVEVTLPKDDKKPRNWDFQVLLLRIDFLTIIVGSTRVGLETHEVVDDFPPDEFTERIGRRFYWIDLPARRKITTYNGVDYQVVTADVEWDFRITVTNKRNPQRTCSKRLILKLSFFDGKDTWSNEVRDL